MKYLLLILSMLFLPVMADEAKILPSQTGIVENVQYVDLNDDTVSQTKQTIQVRLLTGEFKGETVELDNMLTGNPYYDIKLKKNTKVILHAEDNGEGVEFSIEDIKRSGNLGWLSLLFCGLSNICRKKKRILQPYFYRADSASYNTCTLSFNINWNKSGSCNYFNLCCFNCSNNVSGRRL